MRNKIVQELKTSILKTKQNKDWNMFVKSFET